MNNVERILIVGGDLPGWMTAAYLNRLLKESGCTVTLVESIKLGAGGVGATTAPALVRFVRELKISERRLMQQCSATYKLAGRFRHWRPNQEYWHPFGLCGGIIDGYDLFHFWLKSLRAGRAEGAYSSYSLQALLAEHDRAPRSVQGSSPILEQGDYAYHLDAREFADMLRELATDEGVNHLFDDVSAVALGSAGQIEHVKTKSGRVLCADLYVDCSADAALIAKGMEDPWESWSSLLPCDREVFVPLPRLPQAHPYTQATALSGGWLWHTPLSDRVGCGYVYSSAYIEDDAATREMIAHGTPEKVCSAEPRYRKLAAGRRRNFWLRNCIALGPAAGSIEPLEATDTLLLCESLRLLAEYFPDSTCGPALAAACNRKLAALHDEVRDFVLLHYLLSERDGDFWRAARSAAAPPSLGALLELHDENGLVESKQAFPETSYHHILGGNQRLPRRPPMGADRLDFAKVCDILQQVKTQNDDWLGRMPPHGELLALLHRPPV